MGAFNSVEIPIFERFQLGGEQSLRGFQQGAVVPVNPTTYEVFTDPLGRILGGNKFFVFNVEYQFLQIGPAKLLAFFDVGKNYYDTQSFGIGNVRSVGRSGAADLPADLPGAPALHLCLQPAPRSSRSTSSASRSATSTEKPSGFTFSIGRTF